jgi:hypothetical protein
VADSRNLKAHSHKEIHLIALGTATASHADTAVTTNGPSISAPVQHPAFPHQTNMPQPGTSVHHHHQNHE